MARSPAWVAPSPQWQTLYDDGQLLAGCLAPLGPLANNLYLVAWLPSGIALAVDAPPGAAEALPPLLLERRLTLTQLVLTHAHWDHTLDASALARATGAPLLAHALDTPAIAAPEARPPAAGPLPAPVGVARALRDGDELRAGEARLTVWHTPGHTPGSICLFLPLAGLLFSGDTLFAGSYGRTDLPGGDEAQMVSSLRRLAALPPATRVLPGHGPPSSIGAETWLQRLRASMQR